MLLISHSALAYQRVILEDKTSTFNNTNCNDNQTCDLTEFSLRYSKVESAFEDDWSDLSYQSMVVINYKTQEISQLPKYGVVQFIRGCVWTSEMEKGEIVNHFNFSRSFFGSSITFKHPQWVIDSIDADPLYGTWDDLPSRHFAYKWNDTPQLHPLLEEVEKHYYGYGLPLTPELYVSDMPQGGRNSSYNSSSKVNSSLEFKTCIYKTEDVPTRLDPKQLDFASPIACFEWASNDIYDYQRQEFTHPQGIHKLCLQE